MKDLTKNSELVQNYLDAYKKATGKEVDDTKTIGSNGFVPNETFEATGIEVIENTNKKTGNTIVYLGVRTTNPDVNPSLKSIMGVSSLRGYVTEGSVPVTSRVSGQPIRKQVVAEVVEDLDFSRVFQPSTRNLLDFAAEANESGLFVGATLRYLGHIVRPFVAKAPSPEGNFEEWEAGDERAIEADLWEVMPAEKPAE